MGNRVADLGWNPTDGGGEMADTVPRGRGLELNMKTAATATAVTLRETFQAQPQWLPPLAAWWEAEIRLFSIQS